MSIFKMPIIIVSNSVNIWYYSPYVLSKEGVNPRFLLKYEILIIIFLSLKLYYKYYINLISF